MPFPNAFLALTRRPEFWSQFFFETWGQEFPELEECRLEFRVGPRHALTLEFGSHLGYFELGLEQFGPAEPAQLAQLAWDDQAHWHPHVLRWEELDLVCRCVALGDPALPHPGLPLALLHRFTPICVGDQLDVIHPLITEAYRTIGAFTESQITEIVYRYDRQQNGYIWRYAKPHGWYPDQLSDDGTLYSIRNPGNPDFPFAALNGLIDAARESLAAQVDPLWLASNAGQLARVIASTGDLSGLPVLADALQEEGCEESTFLDSLRATEFPARGCWVVETLLGMKSGEVVARALGHTRRPERVVYRFEMSIPTRFADGRPNPDYNAIPPALDAALGAAGLGAAGMYGASSSADALAGVYDEIFVSATVNDDRNRGLAIIRDVLTRLNVPRNVVIRLATPEAERYPLVSGDPV
jgi:hypothetical protein